MLQRLRGEVRGSTFVRAKQCEPRLLHTLQSVQSCLSEQLFSVGPPHPPPPTCAPVFRESHSCYATVMIHDLITAILMTSATVLASELLVRIWDYF